MVDTFYIMGAGTSKYAEAPLMKDFMEEAYTHDCIRGDLLKFIKKFYKREIDKTNLPNVEELLSIIDLFSSRDDELPYKEDGTVNSFNSEDVEKLRLDVDYLIASTLSKTMEGYKDYDYMKQFIEKIIPNKDNINVGFISMNYDLLLDNALLDKLGLSSPTEEETKILPIDYGCNIKGSWLNKQFTACEIKENNVKLFKPHGSLNLVTCKACKSIHITLYSKGAFEVLNQKMKCYWDKTQLQGLIVSPTLFKKFEDFHIQSIWRRIDQEISICKKIVFLGYSLLDADVYFKYIIKRALMKNHNDVKIEVYTGHGNGEKDRYKSTFGKNIHFEMKKWKFEDYVNQL